MAFALQLRRVKEATMAGRKLSDTAAADLEKEPLNDYSAAPDAISVHNEDLGITKGSTTGEVANATVPGGWEGTDDATSTAPSDLSRIPREEDTVPVEEKLQVVRKGDALGKGSPLQE
jgi:hypothetical protein